MSRAGAGAAGQVSLPVHTANQALPQGKSHCRARTVTFLSAASVSLQGLWLSQQAGGYPLFSLFQGEPVKSV